MLDLFLQWRANSRSLSGDIVLKVLGSLEREIETGRRQLLCDVEAQSEDKLEDLAPILEGIDARLAVLGTVCDINDPLLLELEDLVTTAARPILASAENNPPIESPGSGKEKVLGDDRIICFIGRRDTQVKLRGQRVELSEREYHLHRCFSGAHETVAEVIVPSNSGGRAILVAFVFTGDVCESSSALALPKVVVDKLDAALRALVAHHAMLRARFHRAENGDWVQQVQNDIQESYILISHSLQSTADIGQIVSESQQSLDIFSGPLLRADLVETDGGQQHLFLVAHHLVMDLVSWRIILTDLEEALHKGGEVSTSPSLPFPKWCQMQAEYGREKLLPANVFPFELQPTVEGFWGDVESRNTWGDIATLSFNLDMKTTASLYNGITCLDGLQATPLEIYHAALLVSFVRTFKSRPAPNIHCEGHGREVWDSSLDLSRTVGWFTTIWPCPVPCDSTVDLLSAIEAVHAAHAKMPFHGWGYFTSRYTNPEGQKAFQTLATPEIVLNYSGLYQQLERKGALLQRAEEFDGTNSDIIKSARRFRLMEVSVVVKKGCVVFDIGYNRHMERQENIKRWVGVTRELLVEMAES